MEPVAVCDNCATHLQRIYARVCNLELLEPPPAELLSPDDYREALAALGQFIDRLCLVGPWMPRLLATLREHKARLGSAGSTLGVGLMLEVAEALEPVANLAIRLSPKGLAGSPVSVEKPPRGVC